MLTNIKQETEKKMTKSLETLRSEFSKLRSGRAHPGVLDQVMVNYYGTDTALKQIASISVADPRTLLVTPWEKSMVPMIEKAILNADLGLNPASMGDVLRVPMPPLTEERRKSLIKIVRQEAENAKIAIRNIRREALAHGKALLKDKAISEDDERRGQDDIQKITDKLIAEVDKLLQAKETDLLEV